MSTKPRASKTAVPPAEGAGGRGAGGATGLIVFLVGGLIAAYLFLTNPDPKTFEAYNWVNGGLCFWLPLLTILFVLRQEPAQFGLARGDRRLGLKWAFLLWLAMLLVLIVVSRRPEFQRFYLAGRLSWNLSGVGPVYDAGRVNLKALLYYELGMGFYFFCWEFFFRGFLLFGLQKTRLGTGGAVVVQSLVFMLLHWSVQAGASKPSSEVWGSLAAGLVLGVLAVRTRSILYGYISHWAVSASLDLILLAPFMFRHVG